MKELISLSIIIFIFPLIILLSFNVKFSYSSISKNGSNGIKSLNTIQSEKERRSEFMKLGLLNMLNSSDTEFLHKDLGLILDEIRQRLESYIHEVKIVHGIDFDEAREINKKSRSKRAIIKAEAIQPGRRRRNITQEYSDGTSIVNRVYHINSSISSFTYKLKDLNTVSFKGHIYIISLEDVSGQTFAAVYSLDDNLNIHRLAQVHAHGASKVEVHEIDHFLYILPCEHSETIGDQIDKGLNLYKYDHKAKALMKVQTINTLHAYALNLWTGAGEEANDVYLCIAPEYSEKNGKKSYQVDLRIYRWQGAHFDHLYSLPGLSTQSITHARIMSTGYLAVANYQDNTGSTSVYSNVYRYSHQHSKYVPFQSILTHGARDVKFFGFTSGHQEEFYLAVANYCEMDKYGKPNYQVKSHIFKFGLERFIPFQSFVTYGAYQIISIKDNSKFLLIIAEIGNIRILQYNGWKFVQTYNLPIDGKEKLYSSLSLRPFATGNIQYFTIANYKKNKEGFYAIEFETKNHYSYMKLELETQCKKALKIMRDEDIPRLMAKVESSPKLSDKEVVINGSLHFKNRISVDSALFKTLNYGERIFDDKTSLGLLKREELLHRTIKESENVNLNSLILRDDKRLIETQISFNKVIYKGPALKVSRVITEKINGLKLDDILKHLVFLDKNYDFTRLEVQKLITRKGIGANKLNDVSLSDYIVRNGGQLRAFRETNTFNKLLRVESDIDVDGLLDRLNFNNPEFLINDINQTFSYIKIRDSVIENLITSKINDVNIKYYLSEGVPRDGSATITGSKTFTKLSIVSLDALEISGVNIKDLFEMSILTKGAYKQVFTTKEVSFESLSTSSIKVHDGRLNELFVIKKDLVLVDDGDYRIDTLELTLNTHIDELKVEKHLNEITVTEDRLDVILKSTSDEQTISNKNFGEITITQDSSVEGNVNGVDLKTWSNEKHIEIEQKTIKFRNLTPKGSLTLKIGMFIENNGKFKFEKEDIMKLLLNGLLLKASKFPRKFSGSVKFYSLNVENNTHPHLVNDKSPKAWVAKEVNETVIINGLKTFGDFTLESNSSTRGLYLSENKEEDLSSQLSNVLINGLDQKLHKNGNFKGRIVIDNIICKKVILDGIPLSSILFKRSNQNISGKVNFASTLQVTDSLSVGQDLYTNDINGNNLDSLIRDTLMTSSSLPQYFSQSLQFKNGLVVDNLESNGTFGVHLLEPLFKNIVNLNDLKPLKNFQLYFTDNFNIHSLDYSGTLNGLTDKKWKGDFLLSSGGQIVNSPLKTEELSSHKLTVLNGLVSNHDLKSQLDDIVRLDKSFTLGSVAFENKVLGLRGLETDLINGFSMHKDFLISNGGPPTQIIKGNIKFSKWVIDGSLTANSLIGLDFDQAAKFVFGNADTKDNLLIKGDLHLKNETYFTSKFNSEQWDDIIKGIWWINKPQTLSFSSFNKIILEDGARLNGLFNEINLHDLKANYMSLSKEQTLTGSISFKVKVSFSSLSANSVHVKNFRVNGVKLRKFLNSVLINSVPQNFSNPLSANHIFIKSLILEKKVLVGGLNFSTDIMTLHGENLFNAPSVHIESLDTDVLKFVRKEVINRIDLRDWMTKKALINESNFFSGSLSIEKSTFMDDIMVMGTVDGHNFSHEYLFAKSSNQTFTGSVIINDSKIIARKGFKISGHFNSYNVKEIFDLIVRRDHNTYPLIISGVKKFTQPITIESIRAESLYQGHNVTEILEKLKPEAYISNHHISYEDKYKKMGQLALALHKVANTRSVFLDYFEKTFLLEKTSSAPISLKYLRFKIPTIGLVSYLEERPTISFYSYNLESSSYFNTSLEPISLHGTLLDYSQIETKGGFSLIISLSGKESKGLHGTELSGKIKAGKTQILQLHKNSWREIQVIKGTQFERVLSFKIFKSQEVMNCFVALDTTLALIFCEKTDEFDLFQTIQLERPGKVMASSTIGHKVFLFIALGSSGNFEESIVDVWTHESRSDKFEKESCIPSLNVVSMSVISNYDQTGLFLSIASGPIINTNYFGSVSLYKYSVKLKNFQKFQFINDIESPKEVAFQSIEPVSVQRLLYILTSAYIKVYSYRGLAGFNLAHSFPCSSKVIGISPVTFILNGSFEAQIILRTRDGISVYTAGLNGLLNLDYETQAQKSRYQISKPLKTEDDESSFDD